MGGLPPNGHFRRLRRLKSGRVDFRVLLFLLSAAINRLSSSDSFEVPKLKPKMADQVVEIAAFDVPDKASVKLRLTNLALHSSGVFGNVYSGQMHSPVSKKVAIKKIWPENASTHKSLELLLLTRISREPHKNVVQMLFTYQSITEDKVCEAMVFDFLPATLASAIKDLGPPNTDLTDIKVYTWQLFNGLYYLAKRRIVHRDIKPQNLLIDPETGILKIADFGSAKIIKLTVESTPYQVTRFYRPPELLFESTNYTTSVDVWSAGCILGEMLRGTALWPGKTSKDQLTRIMKTIGSPDDEEVYAMRAPVRLEGKRIKPAEPGRPGSFQSLLPHATLECIGFIKRILVYCPKNRLCGRLLLTDSFFDDILAPGKQRENGQLIATIITQDEIQGLKTPRKAKKFTKADKRNAEADRRLEEACSSHRAKSTKQKNAHNSAIACRESVMLPQPSSVHEHEKEIKSDCCVRGGERSQKSQMFTCASTSERK